MNTGVSNMGKQQKDRKMILRKEELKKEKKKKNTCKCTEYRRRIIKRDYSKNKAINN